MGLGGKIILIIYISFSKLIKLTLTEKADFYKREI